MLPNPYILVALSLFVMPQAVQASPTIAEERQIKAALVYNFIKFVEWPNEESVDRDKPITIGIIGSEGFTRAFDIIRRKKVKQRGISVQYFSGYERLIKPPDPGNEQWQKRIAALRACDVLLFCDCADVHIEHAAGIIRALGDSPILTIGETTGFLESGGAINFLMEKDKVRFEINNAAAKRAKLQIRAQLLRVAKRVVAKRAAERVEK